MSTTTVSTESKGWLFIQRVMVSSGLECSRSHANFYDEDPKIYESLYHFFDDCEEREIIFDDRDARNICQVSTEV